MLFNPWHLIGSILSNSRIWTLWFLSRFARSHRGNTYNHRCGSRGPGGSAWPVPGCWVVPVLAVPGAEAVPAGGYHRWSPDRHSGAPRRTRSHYSGRQSFLFLALVDEEGWRRHRRYTIGTLFGGVGKVFLTVCWVNGGRWQKVVVGSCVNG